MLTRKKNLWFTISIDGIDREVTTPKMPTMQEVADLFDKHSDMIHKISTLEGWRKPTMLEVISEGYNSLVFPNHIRVAKIKPLSKSRMRGMKMKPGRRSWDAIDNSDGSRVQCKSTILHNDLTSFGPRSDWDYIHFIDFHDIAAGKSRKVYFYRIEKKWIENLILNETKGETFKDQQKQIRRPRLSIRERIIVPRKLTPIKTTTLRRSRA